MTVFIGIILFLLTLGYDLYTDTRPDVTVNHVRGAWLRLIGLIPAFVMMGWWSLGLVFTYWQFFDWGWSRIMKLPLNFIGTTARLDKLQREYPWLQNTKLILAIAGLIIFVYGCIF